MSHEYIYSVPIPWQLVSVALEFSFIIVVVADSPFFEPSDEWFVFFPSMFLHDAFVLGVPQRNFHIQRRLGCVLYSFC